MDNYMTMTDAPSYAPVAQLRTTVCPRCGELWQEMPEDAAEHAGEPWEHTDPMTLHLTAWPEYPTSARGCPCCAIDEAPGDMLLAFIEAHKLSKEALEYCIIVAWDWPHALDIDYVPVIWQALRSRLATEGRLRDYIREEKNSEFVRWYLEG